MWYKQIRPFSDIDTLRKRMKSYFKRRFWKKLSQTGRFCCLILCIEAYLVGCYPDRDWTPVAKRCWQWPNLWLNDLWDAQGHTRGWDTYSVVVPEFLLEFDSYEATSQHFNGILSEADYLTLTDLFSGLTTGKAEDELNRVLMLPIEFFRECDGFERPDTVWILEEMEQVLALHHIPFPDMDCIRHMRGGWGSAVDVKSLSILLNRDPPPHANTDL